MNEWRGCSSACFDPRSREGATAFAATRRSRNAVSIRAPARERRRAPFFVEDFSCFDPRSREGATRISRRGSGRRVSFDPRSREGATARSSTCRAPTKKFRSALPRGSDTSRVGNERLVVVSIRAPARERHPDHGRRCVAPGFDPRSREGATLRRHGDGAERGVSIRAPARERRLAPLDEGRLPDVSIRAPARERRPRVTRIDSQPVFRSALPRGSDSNYPAPCRPGRCFDPRSREGATGQRWSAYVQNMFRSALPRGSDVPDPGVSDDDEVSIRAPARERPLAPLQSAHPTCFDPRSREGATCDEYEERCQKHVSIRAPARERPRVFNPLASRDK